MKNPPSDSPRFTCRVARGSLAMFGDTTRGGASRGPGSAHAAACADCQIYFAACDELDAALTRGAAHAWQEAPSRLEQDIMRAVRQSAPAPRTSRRAWFALAATGAAAVLAIVIFQRQLSVVRPPAAVAPVAITDSRVSPQQLWSSLQPSANAVIDGDPLNQEVAAVAADARAAVQFLALNFLPTPAPAADGE
jgi:hypothetical protein